MYHFDLISFFVGPRFVPKLPGLKRFGAVSTFFTACFNRFEPQESKRNFNLKGLLSKKIADFFLIDANRTRFRQSPGHSLLCSKYTVNEALIKNFVVGKIFLGSRIAH